MNKVNTNNFFKNKKVKLFDSSQNIEDIRKFISSVSLSKNKNCRFIDSKFKLQDINEDFGNIIKFCDSPGQKELVSKLETEEITDLKQLIVFQRIRVIFGEITLFLPLFVLNFQNIVKSHNPNSEQKFAVDSYEEINDQDRYFKAFSSSDSFQGYLGKKTN